MGITIDRDLGPNPWDDPIRYAEMIEQQQNEILAASPDADEPDPVEKYDENEPRDEQGRWTDGGATTESGHHVLTLDGAVKMSKDGFDHQWNNAPPDATAAMYDYTRDGFRGLNKAMRSGTMTDEQKTRADLLKQAFIGETPAPIRTFRGLHGLDPSNPLFKTGAVFKDHAFVSTALHPNRAMGFYFNTPTSALVEIDVPKGQKVAYGRIPETEMILPPGLSYRVKSVDIPKGKAPALIHVEVVPGD